MTSDGSAYARFRRALKTRNIHLVDMTARELPQIGLDDALEYVALLAEKYDDRFERAAGRLAARLTIERNLGLSEHRRVTELLGRLPVDPDGVRDALLPLCRQR